MYVQFVPSLVHSLKYVMDGILGFDCQEMKFFFCYLQSRCLVVALCII